MREELVDGACVRQRRSRIIVRAYRDVTLNTERVVDSPHIIAACLTDDYPIVAVTILNEIGELRCCEG